MTNDGPPLLSTDLSAGYQPQQAVLQNVRIELRPGATLGLVGESGSGKSTLARALMRLTRYSAGWDAGSILFEGRQLIGLPERELRRMRGKRMSLVLQSPHMALNPALTLETQLREAWRAHVSPFVEEDYAERAYRTLLEVHLPYEREFLKRYPKQISVGQAQRLLVALAILHRPALLIADEPTSALDPITRAAILGLFEELAGKFGMALLFISHDLSSVCRLCDHVAVLWEGRVVENSAADEILVDPRHPYSRELLAATSLITARSA